jgi:hypothetical protein
MLPLSNTIRERNIFLYYLSLSVAAQYNKHWYKSGIHVECVYNIIFFTVMYLPTNMKFMLCTTELEILLICQIRKALPDITLSFRQKSYEKPEFSYSCKRKVSESVVHNYVICFTTSLYLFNDYKLRLKYFLLPFSVIGMNIHYITPVICIICIFYTMLVCRLFF